MNFSHKLASVFGVVKENSVHDHVAEERSHLFHAIDRCSTELEVLNFINALVYLYKPERCLETGTFHGFGTIAILDALKENGFGRLVTVERTLEMIHKAKANIQEFDHTLHEQVDIIHTDSIAYLTSYVGKRFDLVFFDTLTRMRHAECNLMLSRRLLADNALLLFHDTSRHRWGNKEMVNWLDSLTAYETLEFPYSRGLRIYRLNNKMPITCL